MQVGIISLFPELFSALSSAGITRRAIEQDILSLSFWNPRDFSFDKHRRVDDRPYGGGPGMVMQYQPLNDSIQAAKEKLGVESKVIYLSPQGKTLNDKAVRSLTTEKKLILLAGRYEGVDERLIKSQVDDEISIGDYVLSGGELPAMVLLDAITRWLPGALGHEESAIQDSFSDGLLDCEHYTRPEVVADMEIPAVLLGGNHEAIRLWRLKQSLGRTWLRRPDLLESKTLNGEQQQLLQEFIEEHS